MGQAADDTGRVGDNRRTAYDDSPVEDHNGASENTQRIRHEIEQTRAAMSETIDALQQKLSPSVLKEQALDTVKEATQQATDTVRAATIGRVEDMAYRTNETIKAKSGGMLDTIRQNPVPAALAAIGIGWLVFKGRSSAEDEYEYEDRRRMYSDERLSGRRYPLETRYYSEGSSRYGAPYGDERGGMVDSAKDRVGGAVESARETVGGAVESARETVGGAVESARETVGGAVESARETVGGAVESARETVGGAVGSAGETVGGMAGEARDRATELRYEARHRARRTGGSMSQMLQDNPLGVGAIALALGAAVGLAVPETEQEHRLLGEYRDDLLSRAGDVASQTMDKVQRVAGEVAATATETARQEAKTQGLTPQQMMSGSSGASSPPAGSSGQGSFGRPTTSGQRMSGGEDHPRTPGASGTPRE